MKRMIALLLMMCTLTACASGAPEAAAPPESRRAAVRRIIGLVPFEDLGFVGRCRSRILPPAPTPRT